jgi:hypothetical protein
MELAVVWLYCARNPARSFTGANGPEREREIGRSESMTAPSELQMQRMRDRR